VCQPCERSLPLPAPEDSAVAAFSYAFPLDRLVQRFKFGGDLAVGRWLGLRLAQRARHEPRPDLLLAPPLSAPRLRERGFNQALELAKIVGSELGVAVEYQGITRERETAPQAGLSRPARQDNLRDAFRCRRDLAGRSVAVVDDVLTTGATVDAFAEVLRAAGASRVAAWVVARTPAP
jgi:ComF family protein